MIGFLNVAGMADPARFGVWDPSLAFVMGGALCITLLAFAVTPRVGACRAWGVESENRPQRGQFSPDLQAHSPAMGQKAGGKWTAAVDLQPTIPKPDRLLSVRPWLADSFQLPTRRDIDARLVLGAVLFGVGWGLAGYCPGPAVASVLTGGQDAITFIAALALGMWAARRFFA